MKWKTSDCDCYGSYVIFKNSYNNHTYVTFSNGMFFNNLVSVVLLFLNRYSNSTKTKLYLENDSRYILILFLPDIVTHYRLHVYHYWTRLLGNLFVILSVNLFYIWMHEK